MYGAVVASPQGPTVLTASAASPLVAQLLQAVASAAPGGEASTPAGARPRVVDVVPADSDDPRGLALSASVLPLVLAGAATGVIISMLGRPGLGQAGALVTASMLAGLAADWIVQGWLGIIGGDWLTNTGVLSLTVLAIASTVAGLAALIDHAGLVLGVLLMVLVGNPWSGVSSAPHLLPKPTGLIGQALPPGADGNLLRSTAFFDNARGGVHVVVLATWAVLGLGAVWLGALRRRPAPATVTNVTQPSALS